MIAILIGTEGRKQRANETRRHWAARTGTANDPVGSADTRQTTTVISRSDAISHIRARRTPPSVQSCSSITTTTLGVSPRHVAAGRGRADLLVWIDYQSRWPIVEG